jgi:hypothetical protein
VKEIIKTWPASFTPKHVLTVFTHDWGNFYFTLGRGKPSQEISRLWYTHRGRILGSFKIDRLVIQDGSLPRLQSITGEFSEWQIKRDNWVAICPAGTFTRLKEKLYYSGFRGWRYFDLDEYRGTLESRVQL